MTAEPKPSRRILLVEDDEDDYILTRELLRDARGEPFELVWTPSYTDALTALQTGEWDVALVDYDLGAHTGLDLVREMGQRDCRVPVILLTGRGSYEVDIEAMRAGAADYLAKIEATPLLLERAIRYALERQQNQEALRLAKEELEVRVQERTYDLEVVVQQLRRENQERLRAQAELTEMQRRLIDSLEAERLQLAQELHDGPMQDLYGLIYQLRALTAETLEKEKLQAGSLSIQAKLQQIIQALRNTAFELRPPTLTPFGLEKAIRSHAEQFSLNHLELHIDLDLEPDGQSLPERLRLALFRIYQVAITNIARHAQATQVQVRLWVDVEQVTLEVQDDGKGFRAPQRWIEFVRRGHLGLAGAAERAEAVGGVFQVETQPDHGTLIRVIVPLEQPG